MIVSDYRGKHTIRPHAIADENRKKSFQSRVNICNKIWVLYRCAGSMWQNKSLKLMSQLEGMALSKNFQQTI